MTIEEANRAYNEYINSHILAVIDSFEELAKLEDSFIVQHESLLRDIIMCHDASKYSEEEYNAYRKRFYPADGEVGTFNFKAAWEHHFSNNPHHWQYYCIQTLTGEYKLKQNIDLDTYKISCVEMICDWCAMSRQFSNRVKDYYNDNKSYMVLYQPAVPFIEYMIELIDTNELDITPSKDIKKEL